MGTQGFVYLIYAPKYVEWSAGIKVLHKLYESFLSTNRESFIVNHDRLTFREKIKTITLIKSLNRNHLKRTFVAIYPETVIGNPLNADMVIRWLLNYPGLLGGSETFPDEVVWAYSENISLHYEKLSGTKPKVLFVPAISDNELNALRPINAPEDSRVSLVYAQKFRVLGGRPIVSDNSVVEITRFEKNSTNRLETIELIKQSKCLHVFENSTIINEAQLVGIPVYCYRNQFFDELIAEKELSNAGISWDVSIKPETNPDLVRNLIHKYNNELVSSLSDLINQFEIQSTTMTFHRKSLRFNPFFAPFKHRMNRFIVLLTNKGSRVALRFVRNYLKRIHK